MRSVLRCRPGHMLHFNSTSWRSYGRHLGLGELMPFHSLHGFLLKTGLKGKNERDGDRMADEDVQATGKRRVGPLEAQPLCGLRHVRHEPSLLYTVSLCFACLFLFFVMHPLPCVRFSFFSRFFLSFRSIFSRLCWLCLRRDRRCRCYPCCQVGSIA